MRVLFVIHELALNGAVTALLRQVRYLRARGDSVTVAVPPLSGPSAALAGAFQAAGAVLTGNRIRASEYDVAVGCTVCVDDTMAVLVNRLPTVWWVHEGRGGLGLVMSSMTAQATMSQVTKLVFPARGALANLWSPLLGRDAGGRVEIVPNIVPLAEPGETIAREGPRILCVGSVYPRKRQADLVRAVAWIRPLSVHCVLAGELTALAPPGPEIVAANPQRFLLPGGLQPDAINTWYRSSDIFCLPSSDENMPLTPLEAAMYGLPVILSDLECHEGLWRHGANALIHPVGDIEMLAWSIRMLIEAPALRQRLAANARATALRFSERRAGQMFASVLEDAIAAFGGTPQGKSPDNPTRA